MGVNTLPKTVTRQRRDCDLNPGPSAPESSMLTTQPPFYVLRWLSDNANVSALGGVSPLQTPVFEGFSHSLDLPSKGLPCGLSPLILLFHQIPDLPLV